LTTTTAADGGPALQSVVTRHADQNAVTARLALQWSDILINKALILARSPDHRQRAPGLLIAFMMPVPPAG
jgi:hypothetical protein